MSNSVPDTFARTNLSSSGDGYRLPAQGSRKWFWEVLERPTTLFALWLEIPPLTSAMLTPCAICSGTMLSGEFEMLHKKPVPWTISFIEMAHTSSKTSVSNLFSLRILEKERLQSDTRVPDTLNRYPPISPYKTRFAPFFGKKVFGGNLCNFFLLSCRVVSEKNQKKKTDSHITTFFNIRWLITCSGIWKPNNSRMVV